MLFECFERNLSYALLHPISGMVMKQIGCNTLHNKSAFASYGIRSPEPMIKELVKKQIAKIRVRSVIDNRRFMIVLQPIFLSDGKQTVGYEALTRFTNGSYSFPHECFIDAKKVNMHRQLESAVLSCAVEELKRIPKGCYLSINISPAALLDGVLDEVLSDVPLERLVLELTEHEPVFNYAKVNRILEPFRKCGLQLAIDDVGAGYSSLWHVLQLKPDVIKIDAKFISGISDDGCKRKFVELMVNFATQVRCKVVAEGVETESELMALSRLNVNMVQGFFLGRPSSVLYSDCCTSLGHA